MTAMTSVEKGLEVFKPEGNTKWPLIVDSGRIYCEWKVMIPGSNYRHAKRPLVLFESRQGVYGVNGAAVGAGGYPPLKNIMVDERVLRAAGTGVVSEWIQAGVALCDGDSVKAREAIRRARAKATELLPEGFEMTLSTDTVSAHRRRIFLETVRCEDYAIEESFKGYPERFDRLIDSGRRDEANELSRQRLKKEDELTASCKAGLREREGLTIEEHNQIVSEGIDRYWPTD